MKNKLKVNVLFSSILALSSMIFPIITFPYVSRILLPEGMGKVSFATSTIAYFIMFCMLGIPTYGVRECSKVREDKDKLSKLVHELFLINIGLFIISYIVFCVLVLNMNKFNGQKLLMFVMSSGMILNVLGFEWVYKSLECYDYITVRTILFKIIGLIMMFALVHDMNDYVIYGAIVIISSYGSYIMNAIHLRKYIYIKRYEHYEIKKHLKPILVFFASSVAISIYTNLDVVMLGYLCTDTEVGLYNAAIKIKAIVSTILSAPAVVFLPRMTIYAKNKDYTNFKKQARLVVNMVSMVAIPAAIFFILYAPETISILSGSQYQKAIPMMQIIMPASIFISISGILGNQLLNALGKEKWIFNSVCFAAILDLILNILLIPKFGGNGAAFSTMLAEFVVFLVQIIYLQKLKFNPVSGKYFIHILCGSLVAALVIYFMKNIFYSGFDMVNLGLGFCVYSVIYLMYLLITKDESFKILIAEFVGMIRRK